VSGFRKVLNKCLPANSNSISIQLLAGLSGETEGKRPQCTDVLHIVKLGMENIRASDPLRKLIRHSSSLQYYSGEGQWTSNLDQAKEFESIFSMAQEAQKYRMRGYCSFVLKSGDQEVQFRLSPA